MTATRDFVSSLPELPLEPFEVAGALGSSSRGPFLTIQPHQQSAPKPITGSAAAMSRSSAATRKYYTQAIYPRVICLDPGDLVIAPATSGMKAPKAEVAPANADVASLARSERFYKLSALGSRKFADPLWCSVKYGPWLAIAIERESCFDGVPNSWELFIVEVPEVGLTWSGAWEDMPPYPSLQVTMGDKVLASQHSDCCAGFKWCDVTHSCIPMSVTCMDTHPA